MLCFQAQMVLLVILLIAIIDFLIGTFISPTSDEKAKGFSGYSGKRDSSTKSDATDTILMLL